LPEYTGTHPTACQYTEVLQAVFFYPFCPILGPNPELRARKIFGKPRDSTFDALFVAVANSWQSTI